MPRRPKGERDRWIAASRSNCDPDDVGEAPTLILDGFRIEEPTPREAALAHLLAFGLQDLHAIRAGIETIVNALKGMKG